MALSERYYTVEDIYRLPQGERAELIDGQIYMMAPPNTRHQRLSGRVFYQIYNHIRENGGDCEVLAAPFAVFLNADDRTYVEPDIAVICDRDKLKEDGCVGAPDWIIEIVSPGSRRMDYMLKLFKYRSAGVREYWIVDPQKERVTVYDFEGDSQEEYGFGDSLPSGIFEGLSIDIT